MDSLKGPNKLGKRESPTKGFEKHARRAGIPTESLPKDDGRLYALEVLYRKANPEIRRRALQPCYLKIFFRILGTSAFKEESLRFIVECLLGPRALKDPKTTSSAQDVYKYLAMEDKEYSKVDSKFLENFVVNRWFEYEDTFHT